MTNIHHTPCCSNHGKFEYNLTMVLQICAKKNKNFKRKPENTGFAGTMKRTYETFQP